MLIVECVSGVSGSRYIHRIQTGPETLNRGYFNNIIPTL